MFFDIIILILLIFVILVILKILLFPPKPEILFSKQFNTLKSFEQVKPLINNGDIILLIGDSRGEKVCRWYSKSPFSHVGILFKEKHPDTEVDIIYVLECDLNQGYKSGVRIMPLKKKLRGYQTTPYAYIRHLHTNIVPTTQAFLDILNKYEKLEFDDLMFTYVFRGILDSFFKNDETVFCSEFISMVMKDLGIMSTKKESWYYSPGDFYKGDLDLNNGFEYPNGNWINIKK